MSRNQHPKAQAPTGQTTFERRSKSSQPQGKVRRQPQPSSSSITSTSRDFNASRMMPTHELQSRHGASHARSPRLPGHPENDRPLTNRNVDEMAGMRQPAINTTHPAESHNQNGHHDRRISRPKKKNKPRRTMNEQFQSIGNKQMLPSGYTVPINLALPNSSIDNLLGIDAAEMFHPWESNCVVVPIGQDQPRMGPPGGESMWMPGSPLIDPFQRSCLRSLASMITCPRTVLPILVGLFTRSKLMDETVYLQALGEELTIIGTRTAPEASATGRRFPICASLLPLLVLLLVGYVLGLTVSWQLGLAVAVTATVIYLILCTSIWMTSRRDGQRARSARSPFSDAMSRYARGCNLILNILFYQPPPLPRVAQPVRLLPISLDLNDSSGAIDATAMMAEKLWQFAEHKYGKLAVRLQWTSRDQFATNEQLSRKFCGLPLWLWFGVWLLSGLVTVTLLFLELFANKPLKQGTAELERELQTATERMRNAMIACAVIASCSWLVLLIKAISPLVGLLRGRPFQRASQRARLRKPGEQIELQETGCYGAPSVKRDPHQCGNSCNYTNGMQSCSRNLLSCAIPPEYARAAAIAAAAGTSAAVTAAAYHQHHRSNQAQSNRAGDFDLESQPSTQAHSSSEEDGISDSDASISSTGANPNLSDHLRSNTKLFESEEFLVHDRKKKKRSKKGTSAKSSTGTGAQKMARLKEVLKNALLEALKVLALIDARLGDRQTRVILCVTGTGDGSNSSTKSLVTLATFVRLIDQFLIQPVNGHLTDWITMHSNQKCSSERDSVTQSTENSATDSVPIWTPNVMILVSAAVPYSRTGSSYEPHHNPLNSTFQAANPKDVRLLERQMFKHPLPWTHFRIWWSIHHLCHVPIYLEDEPPCPTVVQSEADERQVAQDLTMQPVQSTNSGLNGSSLLMLFGKEHELADMNVKCLRHLLAMFAFMGRMINIDRMSAEQYRLVRSPGQGPIGCTTSDALITWLCLIQHWPFHTAWLALFVEEQLKAKSTNRNVDDQTGTTDQSDTLADRIGWQSELSLLHNRALKRLAPAIEAARQIALASTLNTTKLGPSDDRNPTNSNNSNLSQVLSTLEICDLALRDCDPRRLSDYLRSGDPTRHTHGGGTNPRVVYTRTGKRLFLAGSLTVGELVRLMKLTPFLNPQVAEWMKGLQSSTKMFERTGRTPISPRANLQSTISDDVVHSNSRRGSIRRKRTPSMSRNSSQRSEVNLNCPVKLKNGLPTKCLNEMTVNDVCNLIRDIADLSINQKRRPDGSKSRRSRSYGLCKGSSSESESLINDPNPPAPISLKSRLTSRQKAAKNPYEERIRKLNITGNVLSVCVLDELQKELDMSFGDWQLFAALVGYMKQVQSNRTGSRASSLNRGRTSKIHDDPEGTGYKTAKGSQPLIGTVSDTSLALTVKSAPISEFAPHLHQARIQPVDYNMAKSLIEINGYNSNIRGLTPSIAYCDQHRPNAPPGFNRFPSLGAINMAKPNVVYCPRHQEEISRLMRCSHSHFEGTGLPARSSSMNRSHGQIRSEVVSVLPQDEGSYHRPTSGRRSEQPTSPGNQTTDSRKSQSSRSYVNTNSNSYGVSGKPRKKSSPHSKQENLSDNRVRAVSRESLRNQSNRPEPMSKTLIPHASHEPTFERLAQHNQMKDSSSTSLAGEMADEVADLSPNHCLTSNAPDMQHLHPEPVAQRDYTEDTAEHLCNCNYWYSLEKLATNGDIGAAHLGHVAHTNTAVPFERETSLSDSLSTNKSQIDVSSGTTSHCTSTASFE